MAWAFGDDIRAGHITSAFDIHDVWQSSSLRVRPR
jgi:hypothetical protein